MPETPPPASPPDDPRPPRPGGLSRHFRRHSGEEPPAPAPVVVRSEDTPENDEDDDIDLLTAQLRSLVARKKARESGQADAPASASPPVEASRGSASGRRGKALPRSGNVNLAAMRGQSVESDLPAAASPPSAGPALSPEQGESTLPRRLTPPAPQISRPAFSTLEPPRRTGWIWLLGGGALALGGLGFWLGQLSAPAAAPAPAAPPAEAVPLPETWGEKTVLDLDTAMKADRAGDLATAIRLARALRDANPRLPGAKLYAAELAIRSGEHVQAETELALMVDAREDIAQAFYLRAFNFARQRRFPESFRALQASLVLDPFNVDGLYQVGELLRRQGQFKDAVELFEQATLRAHPGHGLAMETIALKHRLALIEAGRSADVEAMLLTARKTPPLSPEWHFTIAALAVQRANWIVVGPALRQARDMMSREAFLWFVDDYFFRPAITMQPSLAEFRVPEEDRARRRAVSWEFFIDP